MLLEAVAISQVRGDRGLHWVRRGGHQGLISMPDPQGPRREAAVAGFDT